MHGRCDAPPAIGACPPAAAARGVPILGKRPVAGRPFRIDGDTEDRTGLMMRVIPYVVRTPE
jgi:type II secretory pathway component GspD/PulD (secretin)